MATVSAVVNSSRPVSEALRERVERAIRELDYRPNLVARALYTKRTGSLGFLVPSLANPFFAALLQEVEDAAHARAYSVFVGSTEGDPEKVAAYRDRLLAMGVDGVLVALSWDIVSSDLLTVFQAKGVPIVGVSGGRTTDAIDCFVGDDVAGAADLARFLVGLGHRRIAFLGAEESRTTELRYAGLRAVLSATGVTDGDEFCVRVAGYREEDGYAATIELIRRNVGFTALVAFNDVMAMGALNALEDQGLHVPERVSVAGFDDTVSRYTRPKLTTVAYPIGELGRAALTRLIERIRGLDAPPELFRLPTALVVRDSTRAPGVGGRLRR